MVSGRDTVDMISLINHFNKMHVVVRFLDDGSSPSRTFVDFRVY